MTMQELKNNKPLIRRIYNGKSFSINLPKKWAKRIGLVGNDQHMALYLDENNRIILERLVIDKNADRR